MKILITDSKHMSLVNKRILEKVGTPLYVNPYQKNFKKYLKIADVIFVRLNFQLNRENLKYAQKLKIVISPTTGLNHIDLKLLKQRKITLISLKDFKSQIKNITSTSEFHWGLILSTLRKINEATNHTKNNKWNRNFFLGNQLLNKTIGIIGLGRIGKQISKYALVFRMKVLFYDKKKNIKHDKRIKKVSLNYLLKKSDIISINASSSDGQKKILDKKKLNIINNKAILVNTARDNLIDNFHLIDLLKRKKIKYAALDVIPNETNKGKFKFLKIVKKLKNLIITPHIGGLTIESIHQAENLVLKKFIKKIL